MQAIFMNKDWPEVGKNRQAEIYYYIVNTNDKINVNNIHLTEGEKQNNFKIELVDLDETIQFLEKGMQEIEENKVIAPDMIEAIKEAKRINNGI